MNQKGKVFSLIALSGAMLFSFAIIGKNLDFLGARATNNNVFVDNVIEFEGSKSEKITSSSPYIFRSATKRGESVFVANTTSVSLESGSIASFRSNMEGDDDSTIQFLSYYKNDYSNYVFQNIKSIKIESKNLISSIGVFTRSSDETDFSKVGIMSVEQSSSGAYSYEGSFVFDDFVDSSIKLVQESRSGFKAQIKKISLFYTCETEYVPAVKHEVKAASCQDGTIDLGEITKYKSGQTVQFTAVPNTGFELGSVLTDPSCVVSRDGNNCSFVMPDEDVTISASFSPAIYQVIAESLLLGEIILDETEYFMNDEVNFMVQPFDSEHYEIDTVTINDVQIEGEDGFYSFNMPAEDVTIRASFKEKGSPVVETYKLSYVEPVNGSIDIVKSEYTENEEVIFYVEANTGYKIDTVTINDVDITDEGVDGYYSFNMPAYDVEIEAVFKEQSGPEPVQSTSYSHDFVSGNAISGYTTRSCLLTINADGTGVYTMTRSKDGTFQKSIIQYFIWSETTDEDVYSVVLDPTTSIQVDSSGDKYHLLYSYSGDQWSEKNELTFTSDTVSFIGMYNNRAGTTSVTLEKIV